MIKNFGVQYPGHVDFKDVGYDATPVNSRWLDEDHLNSVYTKTENIAKVMDKNGYDTLWLAEHHFQREGYECTSNLNMLAVHLAHVTKRIKIGCGFNIMPTWHPLRLAEDYAMADILTNGRVVFGVGRGYHSREIESFGKPLLDADANRDLFEEMVDIVFKAFNESSFSHKGDHFTIPPAVPYRGYELEEITLVPRPINRPVECWQPIVSVNERGMNFMVKHGMKGMIQGGASSGGGGANREAIKKWQSIQKEHGIDTELGENLRIGYNFYIAESKEKAIGEVKHFFEESVKMFGPLGFIRGLSGSQIDSLAQGGAQARSAALPTLEQGVESRSWIVGTPEDIKEQLFDIQKNYPGLTDINVMQIPGIPESVILEQIERFALEVMPSFIS